MCEFGTFLGQGLIVEFAGSDWIQAEIELIFPSELKAGFAECIIAVLRRWMTFCEVGCVSGYFVRNHAVFYILFVRQSKMLLWGYVAEHCGAIPGDHCRINGAGNVLVSGGDMRVEGSKGSA